MSRRLPLSVLLASPCVFLASLYLRWLESGPRASSASMQGLLLPLALLAMTVPHRRRNQ